MASRCVGAALVGLMAMGCATPAAPVGGSACDWLADETIATAVPGTAKGETPADPEDDVWSCAWRNSDTELTIRFDRFTPSVRSVEATLLGLEESGDHKIVIVAGRRGAFLRPGVWYGDTPLEQYGMATIRLTHVDGSDPEQTGFESIVSSVLADVATAAPHVPW